MGDAGTLELKISTNAFLLSNFFWDGALWASLLRTSLVVVINAKSRLGVPQYPQSKVGIDLST